MPTHPTSPSPARGSDRTPTASSPSSLPTAPADRPLAGLLCDGPGLGRYIARSLRDHYEVLVAASLDEWMGDHADVEPSLWIADLYTLQQHSQEALEPLASTFATTPFLVLAQEPAAEAFSGDGTDPRPTATLPLPAFPNDLRSHARALCCQ